MPWKIIDTGVNSAKNNMAIDQELLENLRSETDPILHLYDWQGQCITYGIFTDPAKLLNLQATKELNIELAKRPTGGGITFHFSDLAFSVLIPGSFPLLSPNTFENYALINNILIKVLQTFSSHTLNPMLHEQTSSISAFCMTATTKYDIIIDGKKIGGAAQRRTKQGLLHQGSIFIAMPSAQLLSKILLQSERILSSILNNNYTLLPSKASAPELATARKQLKELLIQAFCSSSPIVTSAN